MSHIKTPEEIQIIRTAGEMLSDVLGKTLAQVRPGISELELDAFAEKLIHKKGGEEGFKKVKGYNHTICIATNDIVVHGIPSQRILKDGDIIGVDCGVFYQGFHTDMAETVKVQTFVPNSGLRLRGLSDSRRSKTQVEGVQSSNDEIDRFLETGKKAMFVGIAQAKAENRVGHISKAIQDVVESKGYSIVKSLVGHGVGRNLHEQPEIPGYLGKKIEDTPRLEAGMTIAIEVIYNMGKPEVVYDGRDDWTIVTADGSLSGVFERTILVTRDGPEFLTSFPTDRPIA